MRFNAKGGSRAEHVVLRVASSHVPFLRHEFEAARDSRLDDLARFPNRLSDATRSRRQVEEYDRLLTQLGAADVLTGDGDALAAILMDLAVSNDAANEYERVVAEHEAFAHLLDQLDRSGK